MQGQSRVELLNLVTFNFKAQISFTVTGKLIIAFVFATWIVQFLYFLNPKFSASSDLLALYRPVCVGPVEKRHCWFSYDAAYLLFQVWHHYCGKPQSSLKGKKSFLQMNFISQYLFNSTCVLKV